MIDKPYIREQIVQIGKRLYSQGYIVGAEGNISFRIEKGLLITPSGKCKGEMAPDEIVEVYLSDNDQPFASSELPFHQSIYSNRPDVMAVIHAHPATVTAMAITGQKMDKIFLPEMIHTTGPIGWVDYAPPGTVLLAQEIGKEIIEHNVVILENHGAISVGKTLEEALYRIEYLERYCKVLLMAKMIGPVNYLSDGQINTLYDLIKERNKEI